MVTHKKPLEIQHGEMSLEREPQKIQHCEVGLQGTWDS